MKKARRDPQGRTLRKGETYRKTDKSYVYRYTDSLGKSRSIYDKDLLKLRERIEKLKKDQMDGLDVYAAGKADLNATWDRYIKTKSELRSTTYTNYTYMYDHLIRGTFGKRKIAEIKYSDVLYFYKYLLEEKHIQLNTLETIHTILHPTFEMAVRDDIIRKNPCKNVMQEMKKKCGKNKGVRKALTIEQQRAFLEYLNENKNYHEWCTLFIVLFGTGARIGEIVGLRWDDVDYKNGVIDINHSVSYYPRGDKGYKCEFAVSLPKTEAGIRQIPMMNRVREALNDEYEWQKIHGFNETEVDGMTGFIFQNRFGNIHNPQAINRAIKRIYESYNAEEILNAKKEKREPVMIPHFSCHHIRHTFCARLCEQEDNLKVIMDIMGHANIETTAEIYAEVTNNRKKVAIDKLSQNVNVF